MFARLFGGVALAAGALPAVTGASAPERLSSPAAAGTTRYSFDEQGRLLSVAYDAEPEVGPTSSEVC